DKRAGGLESGRCHPCAVAPSCQTTSNGSVGDNVRPAWGQKERRHEDQDNDLPRGGRFDVRETPPRFEQPRPQLSPTYDQRQPKPTTALAAAAPRRPGRRSS
ncbi:unnamed protein product, partial [Laminaria digitata]